MLLLVKCYDNKMVKKPGFSSKGKPHATNQQKNYLRKKYLKESHFRIKAAVQIS